MFMTKKEKTNHTTTLSDKDDPYSTIVAGIPTCYDTTEKFKLTHNCLYCDCIMYRNQELCNPCQDLRDNGILQRVRENYLIAYKKHTDMNFRRIKLIL